ncbi:response regulator transcription factor [uncultured Tissierella sp.]|uniref:response regulator transcription factor n=1 Tax=uncultured Tissierella sp. TaxID=448160 RepID=UPI002803D491|nr:response regulator transcription factor [uncultured Tissierella sp.]MDU5079828.1 response regulator transcription factor [Bacillota bacterium]
MKNILIIEDDIALNKGIALSLKHEDYNFYQGYNLSEGRKIFLENDIDLIILDLNLPDGDGMEFCKEIRRISEVPIVMLTAKDMEVDIVTGFELGADDYITKPFSLMVLRARVLALLRRSSQKVVNKFEIDDYSFNFDDMVFLKGNREIILSKTEYKLLNILIQNIGKVVSRDILIDKIWSDGAEYVDENALSVSINRLRNKLDAHEYIKTIYGVGYTWGINS